MTRTVLCLALLATAIAPVLAGCDEQIQRERYPSFGPAFGNAVQNNMAVQIINPVPPVATAAPDFNGKRAESAIERYRAGSVVPPPTSTLSTVGGAAPSSGGAGAGVSTGGTPAQ